MRVLEKRQQFHRHRGMAQLDPGLPGSCGIKIQACGIDGCAHALKGFKGCLAALQHRLFNRKISVQISKPADTFALHPVASRLPFSHRFEELAGILIKRQGRARVVARLGGQQSCKVRCVTSHRTFGAELREKAVLRRPLGHPSLRRSHPENMIPGCRIAQGSAHVAAVGHRQHSQSEGDSGTAA